MEPLIISTIITCSQAWEIINRVTSVSGLTIKQKTEIVLELKSAAPTCPVTIIKNERKKK